MFGQLDPSTGFLAWIAIMLITWAIPLILLVWLIRSVNAMVEAQRRIADQLTAIVNEIRVRPTGTL